MTVFGARRLEDDRRYTLEEVILYIREAEQRRRAEATRAAQAAEDGDAPRPSELDG